MVMIFTDFPTGSGSNVSIRNFRQRRKYPKALVVTAGCKDSIWSLTSDFKEKLLVHSDLHLCCHQPGREQRNDSHFSKKVSDLPGNILKLECKPCWDTFKCPT